MTLQVSELNVRIAYYYWFKLLCETVRMNARVKIMKFEPNSTKVEVCLRFGSNLGFETLPYLVVEIAPNSVVV